MGVWGWIKDNVLPSHREIKGQFSVWERRINGVYSTQETQLEELAKLIQELESFIPRTAPLSGGEIYQLQSHVSSLNKKLQESVISHFKTQKQHLRTISSKNNLPDLEKEKASLEETSTILSHLKLLKERFNLENRWDYDLSDEEKDLTYRKDRFNRCLHEKELNDKFKTLEKEFQEANSFLEPIVKDYTKKYLNQKGRNPAWFGNSEYYLPNDKEMSRQCEESASVGLIDDLASYNISDGEFILEPLKRVASEDYLKQVKEKLIEALNCAEKNNLLKSEEIKEVRTGLGDRHKYAFAKRYETWVGEAYASCENRYSIQQEVTRQSTQLNNNFMSVNKIIRDINYRKALKVKKEKEYPSLLVSHMTKLENIRKTEEPSFSTSMWSSPRFRELKVFPFREMIKDGFIGSPEMLKQSGEMFTANSPVGALSLLKEICVSTGIEFQFGDCGFIFPLTPLLAEHYFYEMRPSQGPTGFGNLRHYNELHLFNKDLSKGAKINISLGVCVAPRDYKISIDGNEVTIPEYVKSTLIEMSSTLGSWFYGKDPDDWVNKHCLFYGEYDFHLILNQVRQNTTLFGKIFHSLSLGRGLEVPSQIQGELKSTDKIGFIRTTQGSFGMSSAKTSTLSVAISLFEWDTHGKIPIIPVTRNATVRKKEFKGTKLLLYGDLHSINFLKPHTRENTGSTPIEIMKDKEKGMWYCKKSNEYQIKCSIIASNIYRALGYNVPETALIATTIGSPAYMLGTRYIDGLKAVGELININPSMRKTLKKEFLVAIWLKNWDSGVPHNLLNDGKNIVYLDFGGALYHKARSDAGFKDGKGGGESYKNSPFGSGHASDEDEITFPKVVNSYEDKLNEVTIAEFRPRNEIEQQLKIGNNLNIEDPDLLESAKEIVSLSPNMIYYAVAEAGFWGNKCPTYLTKAIIRRQRDIKKMFKL